jgi:hypothetical protein
MSARYHSILQAIPGSKLSHDDCPVPFHSQSYFRVRTSHDQSHTIRRAIPGSEPSQDQNYSIFRNTPGSAPSQEQNHFFFSQPSQDHNYLAGNEPPSQQSCEPSLKSSKLKCALFLYVHKKHRSVHLLSCSIFFVIPQIANPQILELILTSHIRKFWCASPQIRLWQMGCDMTTHDNKG